MKIKLVWRTTNAQTNVKTIKPSNSKVKDIIGQFEADVIKRTDMNTKNLDVKKGDIKNAFEALINTGDTPKRTLVWRRVKRMNKVVNRPH